MLDIGKGDMQLSRALSGALPQNKLHWFMP